MTPADIVSWLGKKGIRLTVKDGELVVKGDKSELTPEIVDRLRARKQDLVEHLWPTEPAKLESDERGASCPAGEIVCRACATYEDREGVYCAHEAVFKQRSGKPVRVSGGSPCPRT